MFHHPLYLLLPALFILPAVPERAAARGSQPVAARLVRVAAGGPGSGAGFPVSPRLVLTARHVVLGTAAPRVVCGDGESLRAEVAAEDESRDLAILRVTGTLPGPPFSLASSRGLSPGDPLLVAARGKEPRAARLRGRSVQASPVGGTFSRLDLEVRIERGDSGSPVLRPADGAVVGVVIRRQLPAPGAAAVAFAVPSDLAMPLLEAVAPAGPRPPAARSEPESRSGRGFYLVPLGRPPDP